MKFENCFVHCYAFSFPGFHNLVQKLLGIDGTCSKDFQIMFIGEIFPGQIFPRQLSMSKHWKKK